MNDHDRSLTESEIGDAWEMRFTRRLRIRTIAKNLGCTTAQVRAATKNPDRKLLRHSDLQSVSNVCVPERVMADRDRRGQMRPPTITAMICGDPLPGYSALDRR